MSSNKLYGLEKHFLDLIKLYTLNKLPKVIMLSGKKGQGKFTLTHHLITYFFDKNNYDLKSFAINEKNKLVFDIKENYNANVIYFNCLNNNVKIDDIRKLRISLQKSSIDNSKRFIIFDDVECLNVNCVNALLKTIEEPSDINYFIIINNQTQKILDTLKSRSIEIRFFLNKNEKINIIEKLALNFNIDKKINLNNSTLTPGMYLKFNKIVTEEKIDLDMRLITNIEKLLKLNKVKKDIDYFNFAIYLINQYYLDKSKNQLNIENYNDSRINIIKKLHESNKLNLNQANLITELENYI
jgi:DNA polymerase III delta prime subunit